MPADAPVETRPATLVELPLGSSLDRLVGALDLGRALAGERAFEAGLLARAHQGILYVDEVNLLPDHLVDALLDAAATGVSRVERDAVSAVHAARFLLVGTMNVEEGELRPQLLDRFGLGVEVRGPREPALRAEIVRRRLAFERDPERFAADWRGAEEALAARIASARACLPRVRLSERELQRIVAACAAAGHRRRARRHRDRAHRARPGRAGRRRRGGGGARPPCCGHGTVAPAPTRSARRRGRPRPTTSSGRWTISRPTTRRPRARRRAAAGSEPIPSEGGAQAPARERLDAPAAARLPAEALRIAGTGSGPVGRRARSSGPTAGAIDSRGATPGSTDIAIVATLRARLAGEDPRGLREHVRGGRESVLLCLVVDASGSMGARARLARVKGALLELLRDAYARRDRVAVVAFRDREGHLLVPPGAPLEIAAEAIGRLATGGRTPLAEGLALAEQVVRRESARDRSRRTVSVILTDGRVQDPAGAVRRAAASLGRATDAAHVIDIEDGHVRLGLAAELAQAAGARLHTLTSPPRMPRTAA